MKRGRGSGRYKRRDVEGEVARRYRGGGMEREGKRERDRERLWKG